MFREMRRSEQCLDEKSVEEVLLNNHTGVLSLLGDDGYPYGVPLNYVFLANAFYFHGALSGHKVDAIKANGKASFTIIDQNRLVTEEYSTSYRSVIAFGRASLVENPFEKRSAVSFLAQTLAPLESDEHLEQTLSHHFDKMVVIKMRVEHITGKESTDLLEQRKKK